MPAAPFHVEKRSGQGRPRPAHPMPRGALALACVLAAGAILGIGAVRATGVPPSALPPVAAVAAERMVVIAGDGLRAGVRVTEAATGAVIADLDRDSAGFVAGVSRSLQRERMKHGMAAELPVRLVRWEDGRVSLIDPATGWRAELVGFGPDNLEAFDRLLD